MILKITEKNSITDALKKLNQGDTLFLENGIYKEKIKITKKGITIIGESQEKTIIENDDYSLKVHNDGYEYNTFRTYTVMVNADDVTFKNLTIKNSCNNSNRCGQAVALHVLGDNFLLENCTLFGYQDTLFAGPLPEDSIIRYENFLPKDELNSRETYQIYRNSTIFGDVDFIFGGGNCYFDNCIINCLDTGYIAAPSHSKDAKFGFIFNNCTINSLKENIEIKLARPWREYGKTVFLNTNMPKEVIPQGWSIWSGTNRHEKCYFAEYKSNCDTSMRLSWGHILNDTEASFYKIENFIK